MILLFFKSNLKFLIIKSILKHIEKTEQQQTNNKQTTNKQQTNNKQTTKWLDSLLTKSRWTSL